MGCGGRCLDAGKIQDVLLRRCGRKAVGAKATLKRSAMYGGQLLACQRSLCIIANLLSQE
jgi:hypothetical protein